MNSGACAAPSQQQAVEIRNGTLIVQGVALEVDAASALVPQETEFIPKVAKSYAVGPGTEWSNAKWHLLCYAPRLDAEHKTDRS